MQVPSEVEVFIDTNIFLYSITEHPKYGVWCEESLERVRNGDLSGTISVVVLNELLHKLIIAEIAEKKNIKLPAAVNHIKKHPKILKDLKAYNIVEEVQTEYNLTVHGIKRANFSLACKLMKEHHLLSNDALHLAVMEQEGINNIATNDGDFDGIKAVKVWKPQPEV